MKLDVFDGDVRIDTLTLTKDTTVLGRALDVDIRIEHASTSRKHCEIVRDSYGFSLIDLKSSQGTHLNGVKIAPNDPIKLYDGAQIRIGASARVYKVIMSDNAAAEAAAEAEERMRVERLEEEKQRREHERMERERYERERYERERADRERAEREERERAERDHYERDRAEREERDRYARERDERERYERERLERERIDNLIREQPQRKPSIGSMSTSQAAYNSSSNSFTGYGASAPGGTVPKLNMAANTSAPKAGAAHGQVVQDEGHTATEKVFASPRSTTPFKKGAVHAVREQIEQKLESERTARDSTRDSIRGPSPARGLSPARGISPAPQHYGSSNSSSYDPPQRSGSFSASNGASRGGASPKRSVAANGVGTGVAALPHHQQDVVASVLQLLSDAKLSGVEKAQVIAAVSHRIGVR